MAGINYEAKYYEIMENIKRAKMEHGDCKSGERYNGVPMACTACMAKIHIEEMIKDYKGPRIIAS